MYLGRIVEIGRAGRGDRVPAPSLHPGPHPGGVRAGPGRVQRLKELPIRGEIPSAAAIPRGCRFHPRCVFARPECADLAEPELEPVGPDHYAACRRLKEI